MRDYRYDYDCDHESNHRFVATVAIFALLLALIASISVMSRAFRELEHAEQALEQAVQEIEKRDKKIAEYQEAFEGVPDAMESYIAREKSYKDTFELLRQEREYYKSIVPKEERWVADEEMDDLMEYLLGSNT